jgi:hypothetical protein
MLLYDVIIEIIQELQGIHSRVFPWMVADWIDFYDLSCSERTARRYMSRMAKEGQLTRLGPRKGYLSNNEG